MVKCELQDAERVYVNGILQNGQEPGNNKPFCEVPKTRNLVSLLLKRNGNVITDSLSNTESLNSQFKSAHNY